jgi:DNA excision repair protein ERCC-2
LIPKNKILKTKRTMDQCTKNIDTLEEHIRKLKKENQERIQDEYEKLVEGLRRVQKEREEDERAWINPVLPNQILQETIPGSIRTAEHFMMVSNLER